MATVTDRPRTASLVEADRKVHDPLQRLRSYIRRYVITEAVTGLLIWLSLCFWVSLLFDWGSFKAFGWDWAQLDPHRWFRALLLGGGLILVAFLVEWRKVLKVHTRAANPARGTAPPPASLLENRPLFFTIAAVVVVVYFAGWITLSYFTRDSAVSPWVIGLVVFGLLVLFTALIVTKRMLYEFRDATLALVLERRYPKLLGDRLITAVELANVKEATELGYSRAMIEQTIREAADRVDQLNIREVFDWRRLYVQAALAVLLSVGVYGLVWGGTKVAGTVRKANAPEFVAALEGSGRFHEATFNQNMGLWFERNVLLDNEPWLKRCQLELINFPASGEFKMGKGMTPPDLHAAAYEYVIHDPGHKDRWRPMTLAEAGQLINSSATTSGDWKPRNESLGLTVDELQIKVEQLSVDGKRTPEQDKLLAENEAFLAALNAKVAETSMARSARRLTIPQQLVVKYWGRNKAGEVTLSKLENNEYKGRIDELTEPVSFDVRAEDFKSDTYRINVLEPPRISRIEVTEYRPAYLYYLADRRTPVGPKDPPVDDERLQLAGQKQAMKARVIGDDEVRPEIASPAGSDVELLCITDKPMQSNSVRIKAEGTAQLAPFSLQEVGSDRFTIRFNNVRTPQEMVVTFVDIDGVPGTRKMNVRPREDAIPEISKFEPAVVRKVGDRYMVTAQAIVPFITVVSDEQGLSGLTYHYTVQEAPSQAEEAMRFARVATAIGLDLNGPAAPLTFPPIHHELPRTLERNEQTTEGTQPMAWFNTRLENRRLTLAGQLGLNATRRPSHEELKASLRLDDVRLISFRELAELDDYLHKKVEGREGQRERDKDFVEPPREGIREANLKGFDLSFITRKEGSLERPLKASGHEIQRRYLLDLWLGVKDSNIDKPGRGERSSTHFPFAVVSDIDLLYEIGLEEQRLFDELKKTYDELEKAKRQMTALRFDIPPTADRKVDFLAYSVRAEEVEKAVREGLRVTTKVHLDYDRILREMRTNRIQVSNKDLVDRIHLRIVNPLDKSREEDFRYTTEEVAGLRKVLDAAGVEDRERLNRAKAAAERSEKELEILVKNLQEILLQMHDIVKLHELIAIIRAMEEKERLTVEKIRARIKVVEDKIFEGLGPKKDEKKEEKKDDKKNP